METTCRIHSVESLGGLDGPGIRCVFFFQGCPLRCRYCQNPDTQTLTGGSLMSISEMMRIVDRMRPYFGDREGGVTLSGGEPLAQPEGAAAMLQACRKAGVHTAVDTGGGCADAASRAALALADLVLLDIKHPDPQRAQELTGVGIAGALTLLQDAEARQQAVCIRHVVVPGWSDTLDDIQLLAALLKPYRCIQRVELLPFHRLGDAKYLQLGRTNPMGETPSMDKARLMALQKAVFGK
jgi:pyruvate formate lyase activating enzyme